MAKSNTVNFQNLSPIMFLQRAVKYFPEKVAFEDPTSSKTYRQFSIDVYALAKDLIKYGIKENNKVAILHNNSYVALLVHFAISITKACMVPINTMLDPKTISYILEHTEAKLLLTTPELLAPNYAQYVQHVVINWENANNYTYEYNLEFIDKLEIYEHEIISINYTSGTSSGIPKGVMCTHRGAYLNALGECIQANLDSACRYLWVLPMFHCNGWCFPWAVTAVAGTHVFINKKITAQNIIDAICDYNITHFSAAPVILRMLMECPNINKLHKRKITIITAGSSPSPSVISYFKNRSITLLHVYGLTETFGPHAICEIKYLSKKLSNERLHTQGIASIHGMYMRVVNENMQDVPKDGKSLGEVIVRGNNIMAGYYKDLSATEHAFKDGWFHTEDLAIVHPNGYMEIMDRKKDIIISGGENISSIQIENALCSHEAVSLAAVLSKADEQWGEVPIAVIELAFGKKVTELELIQHCKTLLPSFMCPKKILFKQLPLSSTGKVQKKLLKEQILVAGLI